MVLVSDSWKWDLHMQLSRLANCSSLVLLVSDGFTNTHYSSSHYQDIWFYSEFIVSTFPIIFFGLFLIGFDEVVSGFALNKQNTVYGIYRQQICTKRFQRNSKLHRKLFYDEKAIHQTILILLLNCLFDSMDEGQMFSRIIQTSTNRRRRFYYLRNRLLIDAE